MSTTAEIRQTLPAGTWELDPVHSSIGFEIEYMIGTFRGQFRDVTAELAVDGESARLSGFARVVSVDVKDDDLAAHLQSPEFFDAERHPELRFESHEITRTGDEVTVTGEITIKGVARPIELAGTLAQPITDAFGRERLGLELAATIDRTEFGLDWNMPLPTGKPALSDEVTIVAELYFVNEG